MKKLLIFLFASPLVAQVQIGKNVQIGAGANASPFITSLTTTGTSGPATVASGVLNIPQYAFNFTLGSTPITDGSTITAVTGLAVNGVTLNAAGSTTLFLNQAGGYSAPAGTGGISALTGDGTATGPGSSALTLATVNSSPGSCGDATHVCQVTTNGKGLTTSQTAVTITATGAVASVANSDGTLTISPTTGSVVASLNLAHANTWTAPITVSDGTGKAGNIGLLAGTAPTAAPANTVQINAPTSVTAYSVNLPGAQGTGALTNNGSGVLSWTPAGGGTVTAVTGTAPIVSSGGTTPAISCSTCLTTSTTSVNGTTIPASSTLPVTIANGTSALGTSAIASATCATVVTTTATGTASTDSIIWNPNGSIKAITGYIPATTGGLTIAGYPTTNAVNWDVCNWTASSITPGAVTLNWRVVR